MIVLVDTPVWSLALRRKPQNLNPIEQRLTKSLTEAIQEGRARLLGMVRQELLSGIREAEKFQKLKQYLRAFDDIELEVQDYEEAARMHSECRAKGIAGSPIDFLICAVANTRHWQVFTTDQDFIQYAKILSLNLYSV
jgi:predicted nucleic acid-binding protein